MIMMMVISLPLTAIVFSLLFKLMAHVSSSSSRAPFTAQPVYEWNSAAHGSGSLWLRWLDSEPASRGAANSILVGREQAKHDSRKIRLKFTSSRFSSGAEQQNARHRSNLQQQQPTTMIAHQVGCKVRLTLYFLLGSQQPENSKGCRRFEEHL